LGDFVLGVIIGRSTSASSVIFAMTRLPATQGERESESESKSERKEKSSAFNNNQTVSATARSPSEE
jgi:hypothetical protein